MVVSDDAKRGGDGAPHSPPLFTTSVTCLLGVGNVGVNVGEMLCLLLYSVYCS